MLDPTLFGILILDREPFVLANLPGLLQAWLQDAGGFVFLGLFIYVMAALLAPSNQSESNKERTSVSSFMLLCTVIALFCYAGYIFMVANDYGGLTKEEQEYKAKLAADPNLHVKVEPPKWSTRLQFLVLMAGGLFSILGAAHPVVASFSRLRFRRIWALARLAFLEAVRNRVIWVFLIILIPIMFPMAWFLPTKAENELRLRVTTISVTVQFVLILTASLIASIAISNDVKNQNIYTIVTKPVERFEILLGRFFGYAVLMTAALAGMTLVSLGFISTANINEKAREESYTARVPVRGQLKFQSRRVDFEGTDVGREFSYRRYIAGDPLSPQRAIWTFAEVPSRLQRAENDAVPCEFTFDIFRLTKGEENRGVDVNVRVTSWKVGQEPPVADLDGVWKWSDPEQEQKYLAEAKELLQKIPAFATITDVNSALATPQDSPNWPAVWKVVNQLAEKYGFYEIPTKEVYDYHPERVLVPAGLFRNAAEGNPGKLADGSVPPRVKVYVKCLSRSQMLGMAEPDLYLMEAEQPFAVNYLKSAVGVWCRVLLVIGLAICLSAYLDGVVTILAVFFLFLSGFFTDYLAEMSSGKSATGGPFTSLNQLLQAKHSTMTDEVSAASKAALLGDSGFAWLVRRFINFVPDVNAFSWTPFVSEGFNISIEYLIMNVLTVLAYLIPWFLLGFFLIRSREVAA